MVKKGTTITDDPHPWDTLAKLLMRKEVQALASLVLPGIDVGMALDKELKIKSVQGDFFFYSILENLPIILHFEFQKKKGTMVTKDGKVKTTHRWMWKYNSAMDIRMGRPVDSRPWA